MVNWRVSTLRPVGRVWGLGGRGTGLYASNNFVGSGIRVPVNCELVAWYSVLRVLAN